MEDSRGKPQEEASRAERDSPWQTDAWKPFNSELRSPLGGHGVDVLFRSQNHHLVPALVQHFCDSQTRKEVPTSSARSYSKTLHIRASPPAFQPVEPFRVAPSALPPARLRPVCKYSTELPPHTYRTSNLIPRKI